MKKIYFVTSAINDVPTIKYIGEFIIHGGTEEFVQNLLRQNDGIDSYGALVVYKDSSVRVIGKKFI